MDALRGWVGRPLPQAGPDSPEHFYGSETLTLAAAPDDVRVVRLHPGSGNDIISCTLERRLLSRLQEPARGNPDFDVTALSYQWNPGRIKCEPSPPQCGSGSLTKYLPT